jgi:hypothetical protein
VALCSLQDFFPSKMLQSRLATDKILMKKFCFQCMRGFFLCVCVFVNGDDLYFYSPNLFIIACSYLDEIGLPIFTRNSK